MFRLLVVISLLSFSLSGFTQQKSIDSLKTIIHESEAPDTVKIKALFELAMFYYRTDIDTTLVICKQARDMSLQAQWEEGLYESYGWLGYIYTNIGDLDQAILYNNKSMELAMKQDDLNTVASLLYNNATAYSLQGKTQQALTTNYEALRVHEYLNNKAEVGRVLNSIAVLYKYLEYYDRSFEIYQEALEIRKSDGSTEDIAETLNNIGVLLSAQDSLEEAMKYYQEGLALRIEAQYPYGIANSYENIGNIYQKMNETDSALTYLFKALEIREDLGLKPGICGALTDIAGIYIASGDVKSAKPYAKKAYEMAVELGQPRLIQNSGAQVTHVYVDDGDYKSAFGAYKNHIHMRDSLNNAEAQRATIQKETQLQYEKQKALDDLDHKKEIEVGEEREAKQKFQTYAAVIGLALVAVFLLIVFNRLRLTRKQKKIIEEQKLEVENAHHILEEKNTEIMDSITYAKRIQSAILPSDELINEHFPNSFVLYKPKDIVAGDFYWMEVTDEAVFIAAADCTGHGVPGAMVSVVCNNALNRAVREFGLRDPGEILDKTREIVIAEFDESRKDVKDGMDIALVSISTPLDVHSESDTERSRGVRLKYAGAHNPLWIVRNGEILETKATKQPIGKFEPFKDFSTHQFELEQNDSFYIFSDGFVDQFGGSKGKKLKASQFREKLLEVQDKSLKDQSAELDRVFEEWRGDLEQVDDVCVIGVRV